MRGTGQPWSHLVCESTTLVRPGQERGNRSARQFHLDARSHRQTCRIGRTETVHRFGTTVPPKASIDASTTISRFFKNRPEISAGPGDAQRSEFGRSLPVSPKGGVKMTGTSTTFFGTLISAFAGPQYIACNLASRIGPCDPRPAGAQQTTRGTAIHEPRSRTGTRTACVVTHPGEDQQDQAEQ